MNRRQFVSALAAPLVVGRRLPPSDPIVIVGAGLAGLHAALLLHAGGARVVVLEARNRVGGRVHTIRAAFSDGLFGEAGAIRISGAHQRVLTAVRAHGLTLVPFAGNVGSSLVTVGGTTVKTPAELSRLAEQLRLRPDERGLSQGQLLEHYVGNVARAFSASAASETSAQLDRLTWPDWLETLGASAGAVTMMTLGGDASRLSALYVLKQFAAYRQSDQLYKIQGGMDRLPRAMATRLPHGSIELNAPVERIDHDASGVRVVWRRGGARHATRASRVVLAVPFSTLRHVDIHPGLPDGAARVVRELPYIAASRLLVQCRTRFWLDAGLSGAARTDQPLEMWDSAYDAPGERGLLAATLGDRLVRSWRDRPARESVESGITAMAATLPGVKGQIERALSIDWARERWSQGAFGVFYPGQMTRFGEAMAAPEGRLHFAGEHTSAWSGWMEGALESAERAAREVLRA